jgi:hypothetical protein
LNTLVLVLFIVAWAAIAFAIVRALTIAWGFHRRLAAATAAAVAGAFALGAISPFALPSRSTMVEQAAAPAAAPAPPLADTSHIVACPPGATVAKATTPGHLDSVAVGAADPGAPGPAIDVPPGTAIQIGGWIVLDAGLPTAICAVADGRVVAATIRYGITRPDVAASLGKPADAPSGFLVTVHLPVGTHEVNVGAVGSDGRSVDIMQGSPLNIQVR